jgi:DNA-binding transcriptional regulator YdaS (Cro superfamily)
MSKHVSHIERAVSLAGSKPKLAVAIGVNHSLIYQWLRGIRPIAPERCPAIESATGVRCEELRPDVQWNRNADGAVTGYTVPLPEAASRAA